MYTIERKIGSFEELDRNIDKLRKQVSEYERDARNCEAGYILTRADELECDFDEFRRIHYLIGDSRVEELKSMWDKLDEAKRGFEENCSCSR